MHSHRVVTVAALIIVLAASPSPLPHPLGHAQSFEGTVKGVTTDQWGAVIPGVIVVFESAGLRREVRSNDAGEFELVLPAGEYRVSSEAEAFYPYQRKKLRVETRKTRKLKVKLKSKYPPITE